MSEEMEPVQAAVEKPTVKTADTPSLLKFYSRSTDPSAKEKVRRELKRRGEKVPGEFWTHKFFPHAVVVGIVGLVVVLTAVMKPNKPTEVVALNTDRLPSTPSDIRAQPFEEPAIPHYHDNNDELKTEVQRLRGRVDYLENKNVELVEWMTKANDRMYSLAVTTQENWLRLQRGERDMLMIGENWFPETEDEFKYISDSEEVQTIIQQKLSEFRRRQEKPTESPASTPLESESTSKYADTIGHQVSKSFTDENGTERLWIQIQAVEGDNMIGTIIDTPKKVKSVSQGDVVTITPDEMIEVRL